MFRSWQTALVLPAVVAALLWTAGPALARGPGGGGHGGGGFHGGHVGGFRGDHFGRFEHSFHHRGLGFGGLGYYGGYPYDYGYGGYPYYYGGYSAPDYSYQDVQPYVVAPDYSDYSGGNPTTPSVPPTMNTVPSTTTDTTAHLDVMVPDSAQVWVEGAKTQQTGSLRHFVSPALTPGQNFTYDIRARWTDENGNVVDRTRHVPVHAGGQVMVNFMDSVASK